MWIISPEACFDQSHFTDPVVTLPRTVLLPPIVLDRTTPATLHRQLRDQLAPAIRTSVAGTRLPSTRVLARLLGISRNTVLAVYDDLAAEGLIEGRRGAATVVSAGRAWPPGSLTPRLLLREAGYPSRAISVADIDGNPLTVIY